MKNFLIFLGLSLLSMQSFADFNAKLKQGTNGVYDDGGKVVKWANMHSGTTWIFDSVGSKYSKYYNIRSSDRTSACIYDSYGSVRAKMDSSCNANFPRAKWKLVNADYTDEGQRYYIKNKIGRCLEVGYVSGNKKDLKAVKCNKSTSQKFHLK